MKNESEELLNKLNELNNKPGGKRAVRLALNTLGSVPLFGGFIAGLGSNWGEKEQHEFNKKITELASNANSSIEQIMTHLASQLKEPTKAHMALLLGEITEVELPDSPPESNNWNIPLILNGETVQELKIYEDKGWLTLNNNGNVTNMGAGNLMGNSIEDKKRPWGMGNGFNLIISNSYYE